MLVVWTRRALSDLETIADYIREHNAAAADRTVQRLFRSVESLYTFPNRGRVGRIAGTRELVLAPLPYIAVYKVLADQVAVLQLHHTSRDWPEGRKG